MKKPLESLIPFSKFYRLCRLDRWVIYLLGKSYARWM